MKNKIYFAVFIAFLPALIIFLLTKNFIVKKFAALEKNQKLILEELKKIKDEAKISPTESPFATTQNLGKIKEELAKIKNKVEEQNEVLGLDIFQITSTPTPTIAELNFVSISDKKWQLVDVYADKIASSKIVGQAVYGKTYPYFKKENNFYYIQLNENTFGWINSQFIKEY